MIGKKSSICDVMVSLMATFTLDCGFKTMLSQLKDWNWFSDKHAGLRTSWLRIRILFPSIGTCRLSVHYYFSELAEFLNWWISKNILNISFLWVLRFSILKPQDFICEVSWNRAPVMNLIHYAVSVCPPIYLF